MKVLRSLAKWFLYCLLIPVSYLLVALILSAITVNAEDKHPDTAKSIFLKTNGVHLDIVIPKAHLSDSLMAGLNHKSSDKYFAFGWGDENFYINTPTWGDITFSTAFTAAFLKSSTLVHVTRYPAKGAGWIEIKASDSQLEKLNVYIADTFTIDVSGEKLLLEDKGYGRNDDFYKAKGSYSCFNTCNSWVNTGFKESGMKSCLWTPFDFGLMMKHD